MNMFRSESQHTYTAQFDARLRNNPNTRPKPLRIVCDLATWDDTNFPDAPDTNNPFDALSCATVHAANGRCRVLVWKQSAETENGIWDFNPNATAGNRWRRAYTFSRYLLDADIYVRGGGRRFERWHFEYHAENVVVPVFSQPIRIDHGSKEAETLTGLGAMLTGYTPAAGALVFVRNYGLYIARAGDWHRIGVTKALGDPVSAYGLIASQEIELGTDSFSCEGEPPEPRQNFDLHELAVSPSKLNEAP
ncbi:MAG: hypothetical protein KIS92_00805 [Planctomycetota bacterium]|nr:hypothetical protein [Planctomycetota bacterium]